MNESQRLPAWVIGQVLDGSVFSCCGNQDPYPFRCTNCGHAMVLCCECDSLYNELPDVSKHYRPDWNECECASCSIIFSCSNFDAPECRISFAEWSACQLDELLSIPPLEDLFNRLQRSAQMLVYFLEKNSLSTVAVWSRDLHRLADAIAHCHPGADDARQTAYTSALSDPPRSVLEDSLTIADPIQRAYAILGVTDALTIQK